MQTAGNREAASKRLSPQLHTSALKSTKATWFVLPSWASVKVEMKHLGTYTQALLALPAKQLGFSDDENAVVGGWLTLDG